MRHRWTNLVFKWWLKVNYVAERVWYGVRELIGKFLLTGYKIYFGFHETECLQEKEEVFKFAQIWYVVSNYYFEKRCIHMETTAYQYLPKVRCNGHSY